MKQEAPFFENHNPVLIYIAKKLKDAIRLESVFTTAGVDYGVETDEYRGGVVFVSTRVGAFFYVLPDAVGAARSVMETAGFKPLEEQVEGR